MLSYGSPQTTVKRQNICQARNSHWCQSRTDSPCGAEVPDPPFRARTVIEKSGICVRRRLGRYSGWYQPRVYWKVFPEIQVIVDDSCHASIGRRARPDDANADCSCHAMQSVEMWYLWLWRSENLFLYMCILRRRELATNHTLESRM